MNMLDLGILVVLALCAWGGYRRGLIRTVYRLVSFFAALFLANYLYPYVAEFLRGTGVFTTINNSISSAMNLEAVFYEHAVSRGAEIIDSLPLPVALRSILHNNNTPEMYAFLQVRTIDEYISGFFANMIVNGLSLLLVFLLVMLALALIGTALDVIGMLPVIRTLNRGGGLVVGLVMGIILVWAVLTAITFLFATGAKQEIYELLRDSFIATWFFDRENALSWLVSF